MYSLKGCLGVAVYCASICRRSTPLLLIARRVSAQSPRGREERTVRNFGAVYCVVGDVSLRVVKLLCSCFVVRRFVGWEIAVYASLLGIAVDTATSAFDVAVSLCIYRLVHSLS